MKQSVLYSNSPLVDPNTDIRLMVPCQGASMTPSALKSSTDTSQTGAHTPRSTGQANPGLGALETLQGTFLFFRPTVGYTWTPPRLHMKLPAHKQDSGQEPEFEALSYVWASTSNPEVPNPPEPAEGVQTPSASPSQLVLLGENLASAFRHLRYRDRPRTLRVNAFCINQIDNAEKSSHVKPMEAIYRPAPRVIAWLGPEKDDRSLTMSALKRLGAQAVLTIDNHIRPSPEATYQGCYSNTTDVSYSPLLWRAALIPPSMLCAVPGYAGDVTRQLKRAQAVKLFMEYFIWCSNYLCLHPI